MSEQASDQRQHVATHTTNGNIDNASHLGSAYQYQPLNEAEQEIRLMTLLPGDFSSPICVTLAHIEFTPDNVPNFEALSYAWGSTVDLVKIRVGKTHTSELYITQNLAEALPYLRYQDEPRFFWIDAICVNQQDLVERSRQVLRMADIFTQAARVVVWLGPESEDSAVAIEYFSDIASHIVVDWVTATMQAVSKNVTWADINVVLDIDGQHATALIKFFLRPWFERLWIWQEIKLASPEAIVVCGYQTMHWQNLRKAVYCLYLKPKILPESEDFNQIIKAVFEICGPGGRLRFHNLVRQASSAKCKDPRDKLYALLSLRHEADIDFEIVPDYTKSLPDILLDVVSRYILHIRNLDILKSSSIHEHLDLPSWVPDWSMHETSGPQAIAFSSVDIRGDFVFKNKSLAVQGLVISKIENAQTCNLRVDSPWWDISPEVKRISAIMGFQHECTPGSRTLKTFCHTLHAGHLDERWMPLTGTSPRLHVSESILYDLLTKDIEDPLDVVGQDGGLFFGKMRDVCAGGSFFVTAEGKLGLGPRITRKGDLLVVVFGCSTPILLRPTSQNRFFVIGEAYCHGYMDGEAILGPLPQPFDLIRRYDERTSLNWWSFINRETGAFHIEDPRLSELPAGWRRKSHDEEEIWPWYVNDDTGADSKEEDPRYSDEALMERGVQIREFELV